ncbi:MAG: hypothetical protein ACI91B_003191 [Planctomycetota bacterium]
MENLAEYGKDIRELPHVIQYNKRDLPNALPVAEIDKIMNKFGVPTFEAVAYTGEGVFPTLKTLAAMVLESIEKIDGRNPRKTVPKPAKAADGAATPAPAPASASPRAVAAKPTGAGRRAPQKTRGARPAAAAGAKGAPRKRRAGAPPAGGGRRSGARPANAGRRAAAATPQKGGVGLVVGLTVMLLVAAAGVAYFFLGNPPF